MPDIIIIGGLEVEVEHVGASRDGDKTIQVMFDGKLDKNDQSVNKLLHLFLDKFINKYEKVVIEVPSKNGSMEGLMDGNFNINDDSIDFEVTVSHRIKRNRFTIK